jgi:hypothetical protein
MMSTASSRITTQPTAQRAAERPFTGLEPIAARHRVNSQAPQCFAGRRVSPDIRHVSQLTDRRENRERVMLKSVTCKPVLLGGLFVLLTCGTGLAMAAEVDANVADSTITVVTDDAQLELTANAKVDKGEVDNVEKGEVSNVNDGEVNDVAGAANDAQEGAAEAADAKQDATEATQEHNESGQNGPNG